MIKLDSQEKVVFEIRRHWYVFVTESLFLILLLAVPLGVLYGIEAFSISFSGGLGSLFAFLSAGWIFIIWISFFVIWTNFHLDVWIITNKRIIDVEQHNLFSRDVSEFRLDHIQDVTVEVKGILPTLLHFGDIHVQTAGESREFVISKIPRPYKVKDIIIAEQNRVITQAQGNRRV